MEDTFCTTCGFVYKRSNNINHELNNLNLTPKNQFYLPTKKIRLKLADKQIHLQFNEHKKRTGYCEVCGKDVKILTKSSHIDSKTQVKKDIISRKYNNFTEKDTSFFI